MKRFWSLFCACVLPRHYTFFYLFATLILVPGCVSGPPRKIDLSGMDRLRDETNLTIEAIDKEYPQWKNAVSDDVIIIDFYDENGKKRGSAVAR